MFFKWKYNNYAPTLINYFPIPSYIIYVHCVICVGVYFLIIANFSK